MGKVIKGLLVTASVCILLGVIILIGVSFSSGKDVLTDIVQEGVYFTDDGFYMGGRKVFDDTANMEFDAAKEMEFAADEIENLNLELTAGTFEIVEGDADKIIIRSAKKIRTKVNNKTLSLDTGKRVNVHFWGMTEEGHHVEITLPKGKEFHTIDVEAGAGQVIADSLKADEVELEIGAGSIMTEELACKKGKINVGAGESSVKNGTAEELDLDVGLGELYYKGSLTDDLDADCGMGNMDIYLDGTQEDYDYKINVGMGEISIGNDSYGGTSQSRTIDNDADADMDLDCGMGCIKIHF